MRIDSGRIVACLSLSLAFVACHRASAEEPPRKRVEAATPPVAPPLPAPDAGSPSAVPAVAPMPTLKTAKFVLHIGDSTVGYTLGMQLELSRMFKAAGVRYESHTFTAAGLRSFAKERYIEKLVREKDPDLVIIQLGTNNLTVPTPSAYLPDVKEIVSQTGNRACYWVGPIPLEQPEKGMRKMLRENVAPCTFYDSFDLVLARQSDKIHPTQPAAKKWADAFWTFADKTPPGGG